MRLIHSSLYINQHLIVFFRCYNTFVFRLNKDEIFLANLGRRIHVRPSMNTALVIAADLNVDNDGWPSLFVTCHYRMTTPVAQLVKFFPLQARFAGNA